MDTLTTPRAVVEEARTGNAEYETLEKLAVEAEQSTPNGYDRSWLDAINGVLTDREDSTTGEIPRIADLDDDFWEMHIAPMIDAIENGEWNGLLG
jgi:hypothetical protein